MDPSFRPAQAGDVPLVLRLMQGFYRDTSTPLDPLAARSALAALVADPALGRVLVIELGAEPAGYRLSPAPGLSRAMAADRTVANPHHRA